MKRTHDNHAAAIVRARGDQRAPINRLRDLAPRVERLAPGRRDPERFFVERDEIAQQIRRMAKEERQ